MPSANQRLLQQFDWEATPLGKIDLWPAEMWAAVKLVMASDFPMCTAWGEKRIQIYNDAYNTVYGEKHPRSFGAPARESWPEIWEFLGPAIDQVLATGETLWFAATLLPLVKRDVAEECYFDFSYSPIDGADGAISGVLSVAAERTSDVVLHRRLKLAEVDAEQRKEDTFDDLMMRLHDVLCANEMDCATAVMYSVAPDTGAPNGQIWALRAGQETIRAMRPLAARALRRGSVALDDVVIDGTQSRQAISLPFLSINGAPCCSLVFIPSQLVPVELSALAYARSISERVHTALHAAEARRRVVGQMREQIAEQEKLYLFLFQNIQDGVAYCATSGEPTADEVILAVNPRLCALLGYSTDELIGMSRDALFFPEDRTLETALQQREADRQFTGELNLRGKNGRKVPVEVSSNLIEFRKGEPRSLTLIRDISERKLVEAQQADRVRLETAANMAGSLAHDTNNLMTIVIGSTEYLTETLPAGGIKQKMARNAMVAAERACGLTNQLLIYSQRQPLAALPVDLNAFIAEIRPLIASALGEVNTLAVNYDVNLPPCMADPAQLTTAILNLVTNARHAMPQSGTLTIETYCKGYVTMDEGALFGPFKQNLVGLRISDTGIGIPLEIQKRVFEPFFTTKEVGSGTGLGLSIVKRLMDELGGGLALSSNPGHGTTFELYFRTSAASVTEAEDASAASLGQGERVLYVEDNKAVRQQTVSMLRQIGTVPFAFGTGREALEWIRNGGQVDLLFTDLYLPEGISGLDLAFEVTRLQPGLPVLLTSGYDPRATLSEEEGKHFPMLRKPYTRRTLATALLREIR